MKSKGDQDLTGVLRSYVENPGRPTEPIPPKGFSMKRSVLSTTSVMPALLYLPLHQVVHAYIDPGTGSIIIQTVIGAFAAVVVAIGMFWKQIKAFVRNLFSRSQKE